MKRKVYTTKRERIIDQLIGFLAFPLVNVPLGIILWIIPQTTILSRTSDPSLLLMLISALPWLVNGIVIVLAFLLRPQLGVGYTAFIAVALTLVAVLGVAFVAACFVTFAAVLSFPGMRDQGGISLFVFLMAAGIAVGLVGLGVVAYYIIKSS
jgi:hypothetical protein